MRRIVSVGSVWLFKEDEQLYLRTPREERPRRPDWSLGALEDLVWHPYFKWEFKIIGYQMWLIITLAPPDENGRANIVKAPMA